SSEVEVREERLVAEDVLLVFLERLLPHLLVPDAELVHIAGDHHVAPDARVVAQQWRGEDRTLSLRRAPGRAPDGGATRAHVARVEAVLAEQLALQAMPRRERIEVEAAMGADAELGGHEALILEPGQRLAELDRDGNPTLVVDRMFVVAPEHPTRCKALPHDPRLHHNTPLRPTAKRGVHPRTAHCQGSFVASFLGPCGPRGRACRPPEEVCKPDSVPPPRKRGQQPFVWSPGCPGDRATDPRERAGHPRPAVAGLPPTRSCSGWGLPSV